MDKKLVFAGLILILFISVASSEIFLSTQPNQVYTLGEKIEVVRGTDGTEGWEEINLVCGNLSKMLYLNYLTDSEEKELTFPLTKNFLGGMSGKCYLELIFQNQTKKSLQFDIVDYLEIDTSFNNLEFNPNETLIFSGEVRKPNSVEVENAFIEAKLKTTGLESLVTVENSQFEGEIKLPGTIESKEYTLEIFAYEKKDEQITNNGKENFTITIKQKPTKIKIKTQEEINPGEDLEFKAILYDQSGKTINNQQVSYTLKDSTGEENLNILSSGDNSTFYKLPPNTPKGYMNLTAKTEGLTAEKRIYVKENEQASFNLENNTLSIRNIGNVPYNNPIEIKIGNETKVIETNLTQGESESLYLEAPEGEYNISINDGFQNLSKKTALTGNAVSVSSKNPNAQGILARNRFLLIFFIFLIFGLFIFVASKKYSNTSIMQKPFRKLKKKHSPEYTSNDKGYGEGVIKAKPEKKKEKDDGSAAHSLVLSGDKQKSSLIAIKIKNWKEIDTEGSNANETIAKIKDIISQNKGRVYKSDGHLIGVFAPVNTRTFDNSINALKTGNEITKILNEHNRKYTKKINYGIGINSGDIVAKKEEGKLLFTPLKNSLTDAKRISDIAENSVLIGENVSKEVGNRAKFNPYPAKAGLKTYELSGFNQARIQNKDFINSFVERNNQYKKLDNFRLRK